VKTSRNPADFKCPKCSAHYKVVRVEAQPQSPKRPKVCKEPLASMDGEDYPQILSQRDRAQFAALLPPETIGVRSSASALATCDQVRGLVNAPATSNCLSLHTIRVPIRRSLHAG